MDLEDILLVAVGRGRWAAKIDVAFFACADAGAEAVKRVALEVSVQGKVVGTAVGEPVAVV